MKTDHTHIQTGLQKSGTTRYVELMRWISADSILRYPWKCTTIVATGIIATALEINAIALVMYYGRLLSDGDSLDLMGTLYEARSSFSLLIAIAIATFLSLLCSALLTWYSRLSTLRLRKIYELFCSKRALETISGGNLFPLDNQGNPLADSFINRITRMDARYCGRIMVAVLTGLAPLVIVLVACIGLFVIDPILSLGIMVLLGVCGATMWQIGISGAKASNEVEKNQKATSRVYKQSLGLFKSSSIDTASDSDWVDRNVFDDEGVSSFYKYYEKRLRVTEHSQLSSNLLLALSVFAIIIVFGNQAITQNTGWEQLIIYLLALRYALVNVKKIFTKITNINRFYPQLRRYLDFIKHVEKTDCKNTNEVEIKAPIKTIPNSLSAITLAEGVTLAVIWDYPISTPSTFSLFVKLTGNKVQAKSIVGNCWVLGAEPSASVENPIIPTKMNAQQRENNSDICDVLEKLENHLPELTRQQIRLAYSYIACAVNQKNILLVDSSAMITAKELEEISEFCGPPITTLVFYNKNNQTIPHYGEKTIVVVLENSVVGLGSAEWYKSNCEFVEQLFLQNPAVGEVLQEDEDEDEDE